MALKSKNTFYNYNLDLNLASISASAFSIFSKMIYTLYPAVHIDIKTTVLPAHS